MKENTTTDKTGKKRMRYLHGVCSVLDEAFISHCKDANAYYEYG